MLKSSNSLKLAAGFLATASFAPMAFAGGGYSHPGYTPDMLPPNPAPGVCYARVEIPAEYTQTTEDVLVEEGYTTVEVTPAQLATRQQQILVKEASVRYEVRQPRFKTVSEKIMTRPAYDKLTVTPPSFKHVKESMASSAPRLVWKKGNPGNLVRQGYKIHSTADSGQYGSGYSSTSSYSSSSASNCGSTCEIWCLVEEPGETVQFDRKVVTTPARVHRQSVPARYQTVMKQVVADPGGVREIPVPAQHRTITVEEVIQPAGERQVTVPPKYGKVAKKQLVSAERYEWRQVACKTGTLPSYSAPARVSTVTPTHITSAPSYTTQSYTTQTNVAPTVSQMLANGAQAVCVEGQNCSGILQGSGSHGARQYSHGGGHYGGHHGSHGSHSTGHGTGYYQTPNAYESWTGH